MTAKHKQNIYDKINEVIIEKLEEGVAPWRRTWKSSSALSGLGHCNYKKVLKEDAYPYYRGINQILLDIACMKYGYTHPLWVTYKQAEALGGNVIKGEHSNAFVVFWSKIDKKHEDKNEDGSTTKRDDSYWLLRYYNVFNIEQCEGFTLPSVKEEEVTEESENAKIVKCDKIVSGYKKSPKVSYQGDRAFYRPSTDSVTVPKIDDFESSEEFYSTLFHELVHSTGHVNRLDRKGEYEGVSIFGNKVYAKEELVAEIGASFLCGIAGIDNRVIDNSASYIDNWLQVLKNDKTLIVYAAGKAQKAADHILGTKREDK